MMFDVDKFLSTETTAALSTERIPVPKGSYPGVIERIEFREHQGRDDPTKTYVFIDITWVLQASEALKREIGRDKVTVRQSFGIDLNEQGTGMDFSKGKNIALGRLREAVNQNKDGLPWSPSQLVGAAAMVNVDHSLRGKVVYDEVASVTKL